MVLEKNVTVENENMTRLCIIAGNSLEAERWASSQNLEPDQYFYPKDINELLFKSNFHVIVIGTAGHNTPTSYFNKIYDVAQQRGKIGRL